MAKTDTPSSMDDAAGTPASQMPHPGQETDATALGADQVQDAMETVEDQGYQGVSPDPTPRAHYTVAGVVAGKPTPETDPDAAAKADAASRDLSALPSTDPKDRKAGQ